jgi:hypothetical protein
MNMFSIGNHLTPYLLVACTLTAGTLAIESNNLVQTQGNTSRTTQPDDKRTERANFTAPGIAAFSEITERPLFNEGREPPAVPVTTVAAAKTSQLRLRLEGVAIIPGSKIAVLRDTTSNKMLHLETGNSHQGWELTAITDSVATFKRGEQTQELTLQVK